MLLASLVLIALTAPGVDGAPVQAAGPAVQTSAPAPGPAAAAATPAAVPVTAPAVAQNSGWDALLVLLGVILAAAFSIYRYIRA